MALRIARADGGPTVAPTGPIFDPKNGVGATPNNANVDYMGMVRHMSADDFLHLASPLKNPRPGHVEGLRDLIKSGRPIGNPFLETEWNEGDKRWDVKSHDGRHRSLAIKNLYGGHTQIPVHVFPRGGMRARHLTDEMRAAPYLPQDEVKLRDSRAESDRLMAEYEAMRRERADGGPVTTDAPLSPPNDLGLYSGAAAAARALPQAKGTPQQMIASLKGVKPDEINNSGVHAAFAGRPTVTKEELAQHFEKSLPPLQEADGGGKYTNWSTVVKSGAKNYARNYRENLLTLPKKDGDQNQNFYGAHWNQPNIVVHTRTSDWHRTNPVRIPRADTTQEIPIPNSPNKTVPAWKTETPGLVVHKELKGAGPDYAITHARSGMKARSNLPFHHAMDLAKRLGPLTDWTKTQPEITDLASRDPEFKQRLRYETAKPPPPLAVGKTKKFEEKKLLLDELQSDWGQKGREHGFREPVDILDRNGWRSVPEERKPPKSPYVDNTQKWADLGLKHTLHRAAKEGHDRIVMTPWEEHTKRYPHLSKVVDKLSYHPKDQRLVGEKNGRMVVDKHPVEPGKLPDYIGKDNAEPLLKMPNTGGWHHMHISDTDVGGEGMRRFYGNIVPNSLLKLAREHDPDAKIEPNPDKKGSPIDGWPSLKITPKMRESILRKGFKAYKRGGVVAPSDPDKAIRKALNIARSRS